MDCGINTIETQDETGTTRGIEIIPQGCQPVSEDVCKSGFMAPADNVSSPKNSLQQCCKCKEGESCSYCENPLACTEMEKEEFVTNEDCFGTATSSTEDSEEEEKEEEEEEEEEPTKDESVGDINIYYIIGAISFTIIFVFMMVSLSRRPKTI